MIPVVLAALVEDVPDALVAEHPVRVVDVLEDGRAAGVYRDVAHNVEDRALHLARLARERWGRARRHHTRGGEKVPHHATAPHRARHRTRAAALSN